MLGATSSKQRGETDGSISGTPRHYDVHALAIVLFRDYSVGDGSFNKGQSFLVMAAGNVRSSTISASTVSYLAHGLAFEIVIPDEDVCVVM